MSTNPRPDTPRFRLAAAADVPVIVDLVNGGYRGERSTRGWTTEAHLLDGIRTDSDEVAGLIAERDSVILLCEQGGRTVGTVLLQRDDDGAYLGMLTVDPDRQAGGLGSALISEAESFVRSRWSSARMWMTVLVQRPELIAYYRRRGYEPTGETAPFPTDAKSRPQVDGLAFAVLEKQL